MGKKNELLLWYTAIFRGVKEVRSFKFKFNAGEISLHSNGKKFSGLYDAANYMQEFLNGFADHEFRPVPFYSKPLVSKVKNSLPQKRTSSLLPPVSDDVTEDDIFPYLSPKTILDLSQLNHQWNSFIRDAHIEKAMKQQEKNISIKNSHREKLIKTIAEKLEKLLPLENDEIAFGDCKICDKQFYSTMENFYTVEYGDSRQTIKVNKMGIIRLMPNSIDADDALIGKLNEVVCRVENSQKPSLKI